MAEALIAREAGAVRRLSFFFWMTVAMSLFVFGGFSLTYWSPMLAGRLNPVPPIVHFHGVLFSLWMILLMVQAALVNYRQVALHRSLGMFGIAVATAMVMTGALLTLLFSVVGARDPSADHWHLLYLSYAALISFAVLFTMAVTQQRVPEYHRRLILFATIPMLPPGINRLYMVMNQLSEAPVLATYLTMDALVVAILVHDWRSLGRISRASIVGTVFVIGQQVLHWPVVGSAGFRAMSEAVNGLVYYR